MPSRLLSYLSFNLVCFISNPTFAQIIGHPARHRSSFTPRYQVWKKPKSGELPAFYPSASSTTQKIVFVPATTPRAQQDFVPSPKVYRAWPIHIHTSYCIPTISANQTRLTFDRELCTSYYLILGILVILIYDYIKFGVHLVGCS